MDHRLFQACVRIILLLLLVTLPSGTIGADEPPDEPAALRLDVELIDGSRILETTALPTIPIKTPYASVTVPLDLILTATFSDNSQSLSLELTDGSRVQGIPQLEALTVRLSFAVIELPIDQVSSVRITDDRETAHISLRNGDRLTGSLDHDAIPLETLFGVHAIGIEHIRNIAIRKTASIPPELARDLVLHYRFDTDEGDRVTDHSGKDNHGTVHGARFIPDGKRVGAMSFDGVRAYIDAGNAPSLQLQSNFTIAVWIRPEASADSFGVVTKSHGYPNQSQRGVEFMIGHNDTLSAYFWTGSGHYMSGTIRSPLLPRHQWSHIVLQHDASRPRQMRFFIDGIEQQVHFGYETINSVPAIRMVPEPLRIGCMRPGVHQYKGLIDDVMIFDRAVSEGDIIRLANR